LAKVSATFELFTPNFCTDSWLRFFSSYSGQIEDDLAGDPWRLLPIQTRRDDLQTINRLRQQLIDQKAQMDIIKFQTEALTKEEAVARPGKKVLPKEDGILTFQYLQ
jgi:hypothetical protein